MTDKSVRDELAELAEAVRELRDREVAGELRSLRAEVEKLRAGRASHHGSHQCCALMSHVHCNWGHCGCFTWHGYGSTTVTYPQTFTVTAGGGNVSGSGWVSAGSGYNPSITTLGTGN